VTAPDGQLLFRSPPSEFGVELRALPLAAIAQQGASAGEAEARAALLESPLSLEGIAALLLSRDAPATEELLRRARSETDAAQGRSILLYAPCYLSSWCANHCRYCGFNFSMPIPRRRLSAGETSEEVRVLAARGFRRVLLVAGEYPSKAGPRYIEEAVGTARDHVPEIDLEVGPVREDVYASWARAGAGGVTCYQETYDEGAYAELHPRGPKSYYDFRLGTLERAARGGMERLALGVLLGLAEPVPDLLALAAHARFLEARFPGARLAISLPRLRPAVHGFAAPFVVDADSLARYYAVLRLALPRAGLVVSTREPAALRRFLLGAGITQMSAGSVTVPGGYASGEREGGQFEIADERGPEEVGAELESLGYQVCWSRGGAA
jgi:2-iminoacetate synthase